MNIPLFKLFEKFSDEEFFALSKKSMEDFMKSFLDDKPIEVAMLSLENWKRNNIINLQRGEVSADDLALVYSLRKRTLMNFVCRYSSDCIKVVAIMQELEEFSSFVEKHAIETLLKIKHEEITNLNHHLVEAKISLDTAFKELQEHKEELQAMNEEMCATNEEISSANEELSAANEELHSSNEELSKQIEINNKITEELKLSRDYYLTLLSDFPSLIWRCNTNAECDYFNNTWFKFTGRTFEQEYGDGWTKGIHPDDLSIVLETFLSSFHQRKDFEMVYRVRRHDGQYRHVVDYGKALYGLQGEFSGYLGACFDITDQMETTEALRITNQQLLESNEELKRAEELLKNTNNEMEVKVFERTKDLLTAKDEIAGLLERERIAYREVNENRKMLKKVNEELKSKNEDLVKINVDLDNFIYTASHDLKAPVTNLEGLINLLNKQLDKKLNDQEKNILNMMETSIHKFKKTISDLTDITKVQKGFDGLKETLLFKDVLEDVKLDLTQMLSVSNAQIHEDFQVEGVVFTPNNLRSIFYNLISNAIKYRSPERPLKIEIKTRQESDFIVLSIKDNGLGISDYQRPKLFTMFKRFHTHVDGTGIGLYVIKRILENNRGKIELDSDEREGSTFNVYFKTKTEKEVKTFS